MTGEDVRHKIHCEKLVNLIHSRYMLIMIANDGKLECVTSTEEDLSIIHKKTPNQNLLAFKCQVKELEFNSMISNWTLLEQEP